MTTATLSGLIRRHAKERPDQPAYTVGDHTCTYAELDRRSSQVAQALQGEGVGPGDRVAFLDKNSLEHFEVLLGAAKLNAVDVAVNWRLAPREVGHILNDAQAKVLVAGVEFAPLVAQLEGELTTVAKIVVVDDGDGSVLGSYAAWVDAQDGTDPGFDADPDDVAWQLYTSGTTGLPKGAMLTNHNVFSGAPMVVDAWGFDDDTVVLAPMPLFHIAGAGIAAATLLAGCHMVLLREIDPMRMLEILGQQRVTHFGAVPAILQFLLVMPGVEDIDYSALEYVVYGASPISSDVLAKAVEVFGCRFVQMYGLTETSGVITMLMPEDHDPRGDLAHRLRSAGRPVPGVELRFVSPETGEDVAGGEVGEIWCRSPQNMKGYWNQPEETAATITADGWLRTGDVGYTDSDGYVYIHDRVKDVINSGGENVYPAEVENILMGHPAIADVTVIGVPSERWGETVKAVVVAAPDADASPEAIIAFARDQLAHYKCPTSVDFVDALPRTPTGKVLKRDVRAPYWEGKDRAVS